MSSIRGKQKRMHYTVRKITRKPEGAQGQIDEEKIHDQRQETQLFIT